MAIAEVEPTEGAAPQAESFDSIASLQGMSLGTKAALWAAAIAAVPLLAVGALGAYSSGQSVSNQVGEAQLARTELLAERLSQFLVARSNEIATVSQNPIFIDPELWAVSDTTQKKAVLDAFQKTLGFADSIVFFDPSGAPLFQSDSDVPFTEASYADRAYFRAARDERRVTMNGPGLNSKGLLRVEFAAPVVQTNGTLVGVVRVLVPGARMEELFGTYEANGDAWSLIDSQANVFAGSIEARLNQPARDLLPDVEQLLTTGASTKGVFPNSLVPGTKSLVSFAPLDVPASLSDQPLGAAIETRTAQSLNASRNLGWFAFGGALLAATGVGALATALARSAIRPILDATNAVSRIGAGDLTVRLPEDRDDELGILSRNINDMATRLDVLVSDRDRAAEQSRLLADITAARAFSEEQYEPIFNRALAEARRLLQCDRMVIYRFNDDFSGFIANESVAAGYPQAMGDTIEDACIPEVLLSAYREGRIQPTDDVFNAGFHPDHLGLMARLRIKSNLVAPLVDRGQLYGLLVAHHCVSVHHWQESEIDFMRQLALQLGALLERVTFLNQLDDDAERARLLRDLTLETAQVESAESLLANLPVDKVRQGIQSDRVIVYQFDERWQGTIIAESVAPGWPISLGAQITDPCFADDYVEKYQQGRVQSTPDIYQAGLTECHLQQLEPFAVRANLVVPILQGGKLLGLLIAHQCSSTRDWTQEDIDFFAQVATQLSFSLDRAALLESQRFSQEELQRRALELLMEVDPIGQGDLTIRATVTEDEIGTIADAYNSTVGSLRSIVEQVQSAARQMTATTGTNEASVRDLSQEAVRQTEEVTLALNRIEAMTQSMREVATSAERAEAAVQQATAMVQEGDRAMNRTVEGILGIRDTVSEASKKVKRLGDSMQRVSKVVKLIGSFAAQTNLLALNASMEAARAGEEGRGFAVVANQVRDLARQSADATSEISKIVAEIQAETSEVSIAMESGTQQVTSGTRIVSEARQSLTQIAEASTAISELVARIAQATDAQSRDSELVTQTMTDVAAIAAKTSSSASQVSDSFGELLAVAQSLQANVSQFKVE